MLSTGAKRDEWPFGYSVYRMLTEPGRPKPVQLPREILLAKLRKDTERWDLPYTDDQMILVFVNEYVSNHIGMRFFHEQWHEIPWAELPLTEPESTAGTGEDSEDEPAPAERRGRKPMVVLTPAKREIGKEGHRLITQKLSRAEAARRLGVRPETLKKYMDMLEDEKINAVKPP